MTIESAISKYFLDSGEFAHVSLYQQSPEASAYNDQLMRLGEDIFNDSGITVLTQELIRFLKERQGYKTAKLGNQGKLSLAMPGILRKVVEWGHRKGSEPWGKIHKEISFLARPYADDVVIQSMSGFEILPRPVWGDREGMEDAIARAYRYPYFVRPPLKF